MAEYDKLKEYTENAVNDLYEAKRQKQIDDFEAAYRKNLRELERSREKLGGIFSDRQNALAGSYERERRSMNERAAASGINSGAGTQAALMQMNEYQRGSGALERERAAALADSEREIFELGEKYRYDVSAAIAENDYQKAATLIQQYRDSYADKLKAADTLAKYGDFSLYGGIYGEEAAGGMSDVWAASNPDIAYATGKINADQYRKITGRWPGR